MALIIIFAIHKELLTMDHTRIKTKARYKIQRARRLKQHIQIMYMVGQYQALAETVKELSQINFLKDQAI